MAIRSGYDVSFYASFLFRGNFLQGRPLYICPMLNSTLARFRFIAFLEGISFILLVGIAVPMKHIYGIENATQVLGMIHGLLFMLYVYLLIPSRKEFQWSWKQTFMAFLASILPFGTIIADYRWFRKIEVSA